VEMREVESNHHRRALSGLTPGPTPRWHDSIRHHSRQTDLHPGGALGRTAGMSRGLGGEQSRTFAGVHRSAGLEPEATQHRNSRRYKTRISTVTREFTAHLKRHRIDLETSADIDYQQPSNDRLEERGIGFGRSVRLGVQLYKRSKQHQKQRQRPMEMIAKHQFTPAEPHRKDSPCSIDPEGLTVPKRSHARQLPNRTRILPRRRWVML